MVLLTQHYSKVKLANRYLHSTCWVPIIDSRSSVVMNLGAYAILQVVTGAVNKEALHLQMSQQNENVDRDVSRMLGDSSERCDGHNWKCQHIGRYGHASWNRIKTIFPYIPFPGGNGGIFLRVIVWWGHSSSSSSGRLYLLSKQESLD